MLKFFRPLLKKLAEILEKLATPSTPLKEEENAIIEEVLPPKVNKKQEKSAPKKKTDIIRFCRIC